MTSKKPVTGESRTNLVIPTEILVNVKLLANLQGQSVNGFICNVLEAVIKKNADTLEQFKAARQKSKEEMFSGLLD